MSERAARNFQIMEAAATPEQVIEIVRLALRADREKEAARKVETARIVREVATYIAPFALGADAALFFAGWGPPLEQGVLLCVGVVAAAVAAIYGRIAAVMVVYLVYGSLALFCLFEAIISQTRGDSLVWVCVSGVVGLPLLVEMLTKASDARRAEKPALIFISSWLCGWALFWLNAPASFAPIWWGATLRAVFEGLAMAINFVFGVAIVGGFAAFAVTGFLQRNGINLPNRTRETPARSEWANSRRSYLDSVNLDG